LGKILTVVVVLAAVALMVLVARDYRLSRNWRDAYQKEVADTVKALEQRDKALDQRKLAEQEKWLAEKGGLDAAVKDRDGQLDVLRKDKAAQDTRLQELATQYTGLNTSYASLLKEKDTIFAELNAAKKEADQQRVMLGEKDNRLQQVLGDRQNLTEQLKQTAEEKTALESKLQAIVQANPGLKLPEEVPALPTNKIDGLITAADNEAKVAQINLGTDDGVVKGMKFFVYDSKVRKYLATLIVNKVDHSSAAGDLSVIRGMVEKNSHVTNRFE
jgi:hypothetical protein